jgi:hypothetical protein
MRMEKGMRVATVSLSDVCFSRVVHTLKIKHNIKGQKHVPNLLAVPHWSWCKFVGDKFVENKDLR